MTKFYKIRYFGYRTLKKWGILKSAKEAFLDVIFMEKLKRIKNECLTEPIFTWRNVLLMFSCLFLGIFLGSR